MIVLYGPPGEKGHQEATYQMKKVVGYPMSGKKVTALWPLMDQKPPT